MYGPNYEDQENAHEDAIIPIPQGAVVINSRIDEQEMFVRKHNPNPYFPGNITTTTLDVLPTEPVFVNVQEKRDMNGSTLSLSALNGFGLDSQSKEDIINRIKCIGFAHIGGGRKSATGGGAPQFAVLVRGVIQIRNTSEYKITCGDRLYWDLPSPEQNQRFKNPSNKSILVIKPIKSGSTFMEIKDLARTLIDNKGMNDEISANQEALDLLGNSLTGIGLQFVSVLADLGVIKLDNDAFSKDPDARRSNKIHNAPIKNRCLVNLARISGNVESTSNYNAIKTDKGMNLTSQFLSGLLGDESAFFNSSGQKDEVTRSIGELQSDVLEKLDMGLETLRKFVTSRYVGTALSSCDTGESFKMFVSI